MSEKPKQPAAPEDATGKGKSKRGPSAASFRAKAKVHAVAALETLASLAQKASSESVRVSAANAVIDRAYGKPVAGGRAGAEEDCGEGGDGVEVRWLGPEKS